jgi:hypothetical protein
MDFSPVLYVIGAIVLVVIGFYFGYRSTKRVAEAKLENAVKKAYLLGYKEGIKSPLSEADLDLAMAQEEAKAVIKELGG